MAEKKDGPCNIFITISSFYFCSHIIVVLPNPPWPTIKTKHNFFQHFLSFPSLPNSPSQNLKY